MEKNIITLKANFKISKIEYSPMFSNNISITNKDVKNLFDRISSDQRTIYEKIISYPIAHSKRESYLPLESKIPEDNKIIGYSLKSRLINVLLKDFEKYRNLSQQGFTGGPKEREYCIDCIVKFEGPFDEKKRFDDTISYIINFYKFKNDSFRDLDELWKDIEKRRL